MIHVIHMEIKVNIVRVLMVILENISISNAGFAFGLSKTCFGQDGAQN